MSFRLGMRGCFLNEWHVVMADISNVLDDIKLVDLSRSFSLGKPSRACLVWINAAKLEASKAVGFGPIADA